MSKNPLLPSVPRRDDDNVRKMRQLKAKVEAGAKEYKPENHSHIRASYKCLKKLPWDTPALNSSNGKFLKIDLDDVPKKCLKNRLVLDIEKKSRPKRKLRVKLLHCSPRGGDREILVVQAMNGAVQTTKRRCTVWRLDVRPEEYPENAFERVDVKEEIMDEDDEALAAMVNDALVAENVDSFQHVDVKVEVQDKLNQSELNQSDLNQSDLNQSGLNQNELNDPVNIEPGPSSTSIESQTKIVKPKTYTKTYDPKKSKLSLSEKLIFDSMKKSLMKNRPGITDEEVWKTIYKSTEPNGTLTYRHEVCNYREDREKQKCRSKVNKNKGPKLGKDIDRIRYVNF